ncbi:MAG: HD domain-containing phosphohydrolase [Desulfovibrionaceae bacterium]
MGHPKLLLVSVDAAFREEAKAALSDRFALLVTDSAEKALAAMERERGCTIVMSGLTLPGMDGVTFLSEMRRRQPQVMRLLVSGNGTFEIAMRAINVAQVHRYLVKPITPLQLSEAADDALQTYEQIQGEAAQLKATLNGSVRLLVEVLELTNPAAMGRSTRTSERIKQLGQELGVRPRWPLDLASLLSQLGCVALPSEILEKLDTGEDLTKEEMQIFTTHPSIAAHLLQNIPSMGQVAEIVRNQTAPCTANPPLGARILRVCLDLDHLERKRVPTAKALDAMRAHPERYDQAVVDALARMLGETAMVCCQMIPVAELRPGMVMLSDMVTKAGLKLLLKGQRLSEASHLRLQAFGDLLDLEEHVCVDPSSREE